MRIPVGVLTSILTLAAAAAAAPPHHAQGEMAGEVTATTVLLQSRLTAVPGPDLDPDGDIPGATGEACFEWATDAEFSVPHRTPRLAAGDRTSPTYRTHRVHRHLQLWFTEGRDYRSPNAQADGPGKTMWGGEQREWLERTLLESDAAWRVIVSPTPMVGPDTDRKRDNHANPEGFRHESESFFAWAVAHGIDNLLVFCGDRHWQYHSIHPSGVEEFGCGAINDENAVAGVRPGTKGSTDPEGLIKQPFLADRRTGGFLHVTVDEEAESPRLRIEFVDDEGTVLHANMRRTHR